MNKTSHNLPVVWNLTGCELYAGLECQNAGVHYFAHNRNWNMLLVESGKLRVRMSGMRYMFGDGDLVLIEPGASREFQVLENLTVHWIHFNLDAHLQYRPEWSAGRNGISVLHVPVLELVEFRGLFERIRKTCQLRRNGWYRLGYCMVQEMILRGNMLNERGLDTEHIEFSARVLKDFNRNISMQELAAKCSLSRAVFFRKFKETFGMSPNRYREHQLLNSVREQLEETNASLKEIASKLQYDNVFYLSSRFKKMFGLSPREYRILIKRSFII